MSCKNTRNLSQFGVPVSPETGVVIRWQNTPIFGNSYWIKAAKNADHVVALANRMESEYTDNAPDTDGVYGELMHMALDNVNWLDIAEELFKGLKAEE